VAQRPPAGFAGGNRSGRARLAANFSKLVGVESQRQTRVHTTLWSLAMERGPVQLFVRLLGALQALFFDVHVGKFVRVEDLAAFQTFYKFGIFFAS